MLQRHSNYNQLMDTIYLDHNATTPLLPEVGEAMHALMTETFGNPASAHAVGRKARRALEDAREKIAGLLGAFPDEVTFTSGATEANNIAVFGLVGGATLPFGSKEPTPPDPPSLKGRGEKEGGASLEPNGCVASCLASHLEHPCVIEPLRQLKARGVAVEWLPVDSRGVIEWWTAPADTLVCVMLANHETGAIQPVRDIALSGVLGTRLHCDAVQAVGKIPVDFSALGATTLTASAHKFGGPKGVGVLLTKRGTELQPLTFGGHQQKGRRPGTEPVALAVGMAVALESAVRNLAEHRTRAEGLRERFWVGLQRTCSPVVLNGPAIGAQDVVPTTLNVSFPGCRADLLLMALDLAGVACATGSACSSGSLLPSPVLRAMRVPEEVLRSALRFSFSPNQPLTEIDEALGRIAECVNRLREGL
jgi:cysteine desulfurase